MLSNRLRATVPVSAAVVALLASSAGAAAHAQYGSSTPAAYATVAAAPTVVLVTYTEELSSVDIRVTGPDGSTVSTGPASFDLKERHNASVPVRSAGPGQYQVVWHNVSGDDGDPNDGSFVFTVATAAAGPASVATSGSSPAPSSPVDQATATPQGTPGRAPSTSQPAAPDPITPGYDFRVDTYRKRQAIRDQYRGKIDEAVFNDRLAAGQGLEAALSGAMAAKSGS